VTSSYARSLNIIFGQYWY